MKGIIILALLLIIGIYSKPQWQQGSVQTIQDGSILTMTEVETRKQQIQVQFDTPFFNKPQIGLSIAKIYIEKGYPIDFSITLGTVNKEGFNFWVNINSPKNIYTLLVNWFAIVDSSIQIKYGSYQTPDCFNNDERTNVNQLCSAEVDFDFPFFGQPPKIAVFILGGKIPSAAQVATGFKKNIEINIINEPYDFDGDYGEGSAEDYPFPAVTLTSEVSQGQLQKVFYCLVALPQDYMADIFNLGQTGGVLSGAGQIGSRSFVVNARTIQFKTSYPNLKFFNGIINIDSQSDYSLQLDITKTSLDKVAHKFFTTIATDGDSQIDGAQELVLAIVPQDECAHLYSECDYTGEVLQICAGEPIQQIKDTDFGVSELHIKSIKVPRGRTVTLYEDENLQGKFTQFHGDSACIDTWIFT